MGCGTSSPARLHPEPIPPAAPLHRHESARSTATPSPAVVRPTAHLAHASSSSISDGSDVGLSPTSTLANPAPHSSAAISQPALQPSTTPVLADVAARLSSSVNTIDSARSTPSPVGTRLSVNSHRRALSLHASNSVIGTRTPSASSSSSSSSSPQQRLSLAAFPMTEEAKAKLDRQRKRHTNTEHAFFSLPLAADSQQPPPATAARNPLRASMSRHQSTGVRAPPSPSRSQRVQQRMEFETDVVDGVLPAVPMSPKAQREMRLSRQASGLLDGGAGSESSSVPHLASARSASRRVFDIEGADGVSVAPVSTTASEADGSDSDREARDRLDRRRTGSVRGRFAHTHGGSALAVPQRADRRLHNLSADTTPTSSDEDDGQRRSLSQPSAPDSADGRRPRLHLRSASSRTSRDSEVAEPPASTDSGATAAAALVVESPAAADDRRGSVVSAQRRMRRFTKTRHSNAFDGTELANRMSRYDSRGLPFNASISQGDDHAWYAAAAAAVGAEERDSNHLHVHEQPAMSSSSSSSDDAVSPVRAPRNHVRSVSHTVSLSSQRNRLKQRGAAGMSGSYNLAPPGADSERAHASSQTLAVPGLTVVLPTSPPLTPSVSAPTESVGRSNPLSAQLSPASHRHQSRGKHLALLYCTPLSALLLSVSLHKLGYQVLCADTRAEAESLALQQRFDVVVAEWLDGEAVQLACAVRAGDADGERTAVVVVCADGADEAEKDRVRRECVGAGCAGVLESGLGLLTALPDVLKRSGADGCCWCVDGQAAMTQIVAVS